MPLQDLYQKACDAIERGNYDYAIELLREVLRQDPQYPDARIALRGTQRRREQERGRPLTARLLVPLLLAVTWVRGMLTNPRNRLEVYEDYLDKNPNSFVALMAAGAAAHKAGFPKEAANIYKDALRINQSNKRCLRLLTDIYKELGDNQEALKYLNRLAALEPTNRDLQNELRDLEATDHMASSRMEAATSFRDWVRDRDKAAELEASRRMAVSINDLRNQVAQMEKELAEHPHQVSRILALAQAYINTGELEKARKLLEEKNQQLPDNYEIREKLGDVQLSLLDKAIADLARQADKAPSDPRISQKLEQLQTQRRKLAVKEYTWRVKAHPTDRTLQMKLAQAQFEDGLYNEAIAGFQALTQDGRYQVQATKMLGLCFLRKKQYDLALEQLERASRLHPELDQEGKELLYAQAQACEEVGRLDEALKLYKKLYSVDITFRDVAQKVDALSAK